MKAQFVGIRNSQLQPVLRGTLIPAVKALREHLGLSLAQAMEMVRSGTYQTPVQCRYAQDIDDVEDRLIRELGKIGVTLEDANGVISVKSIDREASGFVFKADLDKAMAEIQALKDELMLTVGQLALARGACESYRQDLHSGAALPPANDSDTMNDLGMSMTEDDLVRILSATAGGKTLLSQDEVQLGFEQAKTRVLDLL